VDFVSLVSRKRRIITQHPLLSATCANGDQETATAASGSIFSETIANTTLALTSSLTRTLRGVSLSNCLHRPTSPSSRASSRPQVRSLHPRFLCCSEIETCPWFSSNSAPLLLPLCLYWMLTILLGSPISVILNFSRKSVIMCMLDKNPKNASITSDHSIMSTIPV